MTNRPVPDVQVENAKSIAGDGDIDERCRRLLAHFQWFSTPEPAEEQEPADEPPRVEADRSWERQLRRASEPCPHVCRQCKKAS